MALKFSLSDRRNNKERLEQSLKYYSEKNLGPLQYLALISLWQQFNKLEGEMEAVSYCHKEFYRRCCRDPIYVCGICQLSVIYSLYLSLYLSNSSLPPYDICNFAYNI